MTIGLTRCLLIGATFTIAVGCDRQPPATPEPNGPRLQLRYENQPIANVHVRLHAGDETAVLMEGITDHHGHVYFSEPPTPEPNEYHVMMESVSDGGWILDTQMIQRAMRKTRLKPFATLPQQQLELPRDSVRPLMKSN